jgi:hypothetical protein
VAARAAPERARLKSVLKQLPSASSRGGKGLKPLVCIDRSGKLHINFAFLDIP